MKVLVHLTGIYVFDENSNLIKKLELDLSKEEALELKSGRLPEKIRNALERLKEEYGEIEILGRNYENYNSVYDVRLINQSVNLLKREIKLKDLRKIQDLQVYVTIKEISESVDRDQLVIQAINAFDDLNKIINLMIERFREWYELYAPEVSQRIEEHEKFIRKIIGRKREELMKELGINVTMGGKFSDEDIKMLDEYAREIERLYNLRNEVTEYVKKLMKETAPNVSEVAGPIIGARLIALAGGLKDLALLPASTIQVLGAEKALFRHLRKHTPPPKHGVLFNHPLIQKLPRKLRGRMARTLAAKISIAAKVDAFSPGKFIGDKLKKEIEERFEQLKSGKNIKE